MFGFDGIKLSWFAVWFYPYFVPAKHIGKIILTIIRAAHFWFCRIFRHSSKLAADFTFHLHFLTFARYDTGTDKKYERPPFGFEEVSLTTITEPKK